MFVKDLVKSLAARFFLFLLRLVSWVFPVRICRVRADRIGHMAVCELFFRKRKAGLLDERYRYFLWSYDGSRRKPANEQFYEMLTREQPIRVSRLLYGLTAVPSIRDSAYLFPMPARASDYSGFQHLPPALSFTPEEVARGLQELEELGIGPGDWFACFHSRDSAYLKMNFPTRNWDYHGYRDFSVQDMLPAMDFVAGRGGYSVRMGAVSAEKLDSSNPRIIDYSGSSLRSDFMDVFLLSRCRYIIGGATGLSTISLAFNVPVGLVNFIPLKNAHRYPYVAVLPKRCRWRGTGRELNLREILDTGAISYFRTEQYNKAGIDVVDNSPAEILSLAEEVHARTGGAEADFYTERDKTLQAKFFSLMAQGQGERGLGTARLGRDFIRDNPDYLA